MKKRLMNMSGAIILTLSFLKSELWFVYEKFLHAKTEKNGLFNFVY